VEETKTINCLTFQKQEIVIKEITNQINSAKTISEKAAFAEKLREEVNILLSCMDYDKRNVGCNNCISIASLREKTADLIIKAKKLV
jgi:IMP cyclohydrolase